MKRDAAVVFVHGLAKKPAPEKLEEIWMWALSRDNPMPSVFAPPNSGVHLDNRGIPRHFGYYADVFYGTDYETELSSYYESAGDAGEAEIVAEVAGMEDVPGKMELLTDEERRFVTSLESKFSAQLALSPVAVANPASSLEEASEYEIASWLPAPIKQAIVRAAAMEAYYYLFDKEYVRQDGRRFKVREELRTRLLHKLNAAREESDRVIVVSHSMGTIVAYDVIRNCDDCPHVHALLTLGSPLGVKEVQDELHAPGSSKPDFPPSRLDRWINIYDPLDPICGADPRFANDYAGAGGKGVEDIKESNWGRWRHSATHYLAGSRLREQLIAAMGQ
ncbi:MULTISPECIES: hypothetical protein [Lysobacter]|uniref:PGAP1-like alpha/beta domain-containing protein n=1 Tax=Lysobacter TaxID=68 RepID=UPI0004CFED05|nr:MULTISPECIES: hypothetical protein [Lysobacter]